MTVAMAGEPSVSEHRQLEESNKFTSATTEISLTFTPLPPIRRTSTLDLSRKEDPAIDDNAAPSPSSMSSGPAAIQQSNNDQWRSPSAAGQRVPQSSAPHNSGYLSPSQPQQSQQQQQQQQQNPDMTPNNLDGRSTPSAMPQHFNGLSVPQRGPTMQMHPHQMLMGKQTAPGQMMLNGQTVISLPDGRQWTAQESHLAEPLNPSNRNRSANSLRTYSAFDKETGGDSRLPLQHHQQHQQQQQQQQNGRVASSQQGPLNMNHPMTSPAMRHPTPFPTGDEKNALSEHRGRLSFSQHGNDGGPADMADDKSFNDIGSVYLSDSSSPSSVDDSNLSNFKASVRRDSVSASSLANEDANDKQRRGPSSLFNLGHRRDSGATMLTEQGPSDEGPEKTRNFFSRISHSQPKPKSNALNTAPSFDESDYAPSQQTGDYGPGKRRLSELKGMIKGVGHAKEGIKDDRPMKIETIYESRPRMPSSPPHHGSIAAFQGPQRHPNSYMSQAPFESFAPAARTSSSGLRVSTEALQMHAMAPPPAKSPAPFMNLVRTSTSGSLPGQIQQAKTEESGKKSSGGGFLGGLFSKQAHKTKELKSHSSHQLLSTSQRHMQPAAQSNYQSLRPVQMSLPGQQLGPHPMLAGQPRVQPYPADFAPSPTTILQDPTLPSPSLQTAQAIPMHRAAEITVAPPSSHGAALLSAQRSEKPPLQQSQGSLNKLANSGLFGQRPVQTEKLDDDSVTTSQTSLHLSDKSVGNLSTMSRMPPKRKPLESGNAKSDGSYMAPAVPQSVANLDRSVVSPSPSLGERAPSQLSQHQHSPQLGLSGGFRETHQPSLPSPMPSPIPSQSNRSFDSRLPDDHLDRDSVDFRGSAEGLGVFPNGIISSGLMNGSGHGGIQNGLSWGPNAALPPSLAKAKTQSPRIPSSPAPSTDPGNLSKFFGAYDGGKPAVQPPVVKEKSVASKFLGAFKRSTKQNDTPQPDRRLKVSPRTSQQDIRPGPPNPLSQKANTTFAGILGSSAQSQGQVHGQVRGPGQMPAQQMRAGNGQPGQMSRDVMLSQAQAGRGQNPGQIPPNMVASGRGPKPVANDSLPPHIQGPATLRRRSGEPQYDQVPIPRGYEAVHGYGPGGIVTTPPYHGRPSFQGVQYTQHLGTPQPARPQQQWDPRGMPPTQPGLPHGPPVVTQGLANNIPYQPPHPQQQLRGQQPNPSPGVQGYHSPLHPQSPHQFPPPQQMPPGQTPLSIPGQSRIGTQTPLNAPITPSQPYPNHAGSAQGQANTSFIATPPPKQSLGPDQPPPLQLIIQTATGAGSVASNGASPAPSNHIAAAAPNPASPVSQTGIPAQFQSPKSPPPSSSPGMRSPDAARLTSRMSVSRHGARTASSSHGSPAIPDKDPALDVERANGHVGKASEDIYDAPPRADREEPTAAERKINGAAAESVVTLASSSSSSSSSDAGEHIVAANVVEDAEADARKVELARNVEKEVALSIAPHAEPEEKILVDLPVELAAVHDDDDGIPMMSATSYPGQEWNPYGAGEFGDFE